MNRPSLPRSFATCDGRDGLNAVANEHPGGGAPAGTSGLSISSTFQDSAHLHRRRNDERIAHGIGGTVPATPLSLMTSKTPSSSSAAEDPCTSCNGQSSSPPSPLKDTPTPSEENKTGEVEVPDLEAAIVRLFAEDPARTSSSSPSPSSPPSSSEQNQSPYQHQEGVVAATTTNVAATGTTATPGSGTSDLLHLQEPQQERDEEFGRLQQKAPPRPISHRTNSNGRARHHLAVGWDMLAMLDGIAGDDDSDDSIDGYDSIDDDDSIDSRAHRLSNGEHKYM